MEKPRYDFGLCPKNSEMPLEIIKQKVTRLNCKTHKAGIFISFIHWCVWSTYNSTVHRAGTQEIIAGEWISMVSIEWISIILYCIILYSCA